MERVFVSKYATTDGTLAIPVRPSRAVVERSLKPFKKQIRKFAFGLTPWTLDKFVETRGRKKKVYEAARRRYEQSGVRPSDWKVNTFVKAEKLDLTKKPDPVPRVIQPRSPVYNLVIGVYVSPLEKILYREIARMFDHPTVIKGMNARAQGECLHEKWSRLSDPVAIGFDVHRMDQHVSKELLEWEHSIYKLYDLPKGVRNLLRKQLYNTGAAYCYDGKVKYSVRGRRMSGDMNTGLGNCLIMCAVVFSALNGRFKYYLANNGDDCVLFIDSWNADEALARVKTILSDINLPTEFEEPVSIFEEVEFCQCHPITDGDAWYMVRNPKTSLDKDSCTLKPVRSKREWNTLRASVAMSGLACAGHMPVYKEFYNALGRDAGVRVDRDTVETGLQRLAKGMNMNGSVVTAEARASFFRAFDISPDEQIALEDHYRKIRPEYQTPVPHQDWLREGHNAQLMGCHA
uniref:RNA-directed RNA polymerase n=1 Tax=Ulva tombus-like virus 1 TaxID=3051535 RepID=A0A9Y2DYM0_9TOMB|nr:MAG: RNA-dependent RNA polymerase [Ulva tombus-like virus 1]